MSQNSSAYFKFSVYVLKHRKHAILCRCNVCCEEEGNDMKEDVLKKKSQFTEAV